MNKFTTRKGTSNRRTENQLLNGTKTAITTDKEGLILLAIICSQSQADIQDFIDQ